jgi:hypothetical protein
VAKEGSAGSELSIDCECAGTGFSQINPEKTNGENQNGLLWMAMSSSWVRQSSTF